MTNYRITKKQVVPVLETKHWPRYTEDRPPKIGDHIALLDAGDKWWYGWVLKFSSPDRIVIRWYLSSNDDPLNYDSTFSIHEEDLRYEA